MLLGAMVWAQVEGWVGGGLLGAYQVPIVRQAPWAGLSHRGGEKRLPGPGFRVYLMSRYVRNAVHFLGFWWGGQAFQVYPANRRESFLYAVSGVQSGWRLSPERGWYGGGTLGAAFLVKARSSPDSASVYRFQDYYGRAIVRVGAFVEKRFGERLSLMLHWEMDWSPAWDRGLFRSYNALIHHTTFSTLLSYRLWPRQQASPASSPS
jgi:hypothetical protein